MTTTIQRTENICFPRSGHGLLRNLLQGYFGADFVYCEAYFDGEHTLDYDDATNYQKNHDLELITPVRDDRQYLVQVRYPIESLISWFKFNCAHGREQDTPVAWTNFAIQKAAFWMRFYRKWVLDDVRNRLVVNYADLVDDPVETLASTVRFLGDEDPDRARLEAACAAEDVRRRNTIGAFKYYGPAFFDVLRGLFAAVPGVDPVSDTLSVSTDDIDPARRAASRAIRFLTDTSRDLDQLANELRAAAVS